MRAFVFAGADTGFTRDSSACAIVQRLTDYYILLALEEMRPKRGAPLRPSVVARTFAELAANYGVHEICADRHYAESLREHLRERGVRLIASPDGQSGKVAMYVELRRLVNEGRLRIPRHPRLIAQLKALTSKPTSGGGLTISSPRQAGGGHGDLVSALAAAIWRASRTRREAQSSGPIRFSGPAPGHPGVIVARSADGRVIGSVYVSGDVDHMDASMIPSFERGARSDYGPNLASWLAENVVGPRMPH